MEVHSLAAKVCNINAPVLLWGAGGTGKEAVARWIHLHSRNAGGQFVKVNCAAIPGTLLESELFGYEKGAFTGAHVSKPGRVELAQNGTLFLDEIADLDAGIQSKLLQFLQDGSYSRIGGAEEKLVETRLICATGKDLQHGIEAGTFRADLYFRRQRFGDQQRLFLRATLDLRFLSRRRPGWRDDHYLRPQFRWGERCDP